MSAVIGIAIIVTGTLAAAMTPVIMILATETAVVMTATETVRIIGNIEGARGDALGKIVLNRRRYIFFL